MPRGISHFENLPIRSFISVLNRLDEYTVSEKIDGSNLRFGLDESGKFYTSREHFGTRRKYSLDEYGMNFSMTFQRYAHAVLVQHLDILKDAGLSCGDCIEVEILYGGLANVVRYNQNVNRIVLLRTVRGSVDIVSIQNALMYKQVTIELTVPYTTDGCTILTKEQETTWEFCIVPELPVEKKINVEQQATLSEMAEDIELFLSRDSGIEKFTNEEILTLPLNKRPLVITGKWAVIRAVMKARRRDLLVILEAKYIRPVISLLLYIFVHNRRSIFGPRSQSSWIEGVVFRHVDTGEQVKLVDKAMFMHIKNFLWRERDLIQKKARSVNEELSFYGSLLMDLSVNLGHPVLATTRASRYLDKIGNTATFNHGLVETKRIWARIIEEYQYRIIYLIDEFVARADDNILILRCSRYRYCDIINARTLEVFSFINKRLQNFEKNIPLANDMTELASLITNNGEYKDKE